MLVHSGMHVGNCFCRMMRGESNWIHHRGNWGMESTFINANLIKHMYCSFAREHQRLSKAFQKFSGTGQATDNRLSHFHQLALLYSNALNPEEFGCVARPLVSTVWRNLKTPLGLLLEISWNLKLVCIFCIAGCNNVSERRMGCHGLASVWWNRGLRGLKANGYEWIRISWVWALAPKGKN